MPENLFFSKLKIHLGSVAPNLISDGKLPSDRFKVVVVIVVVVVLVVVVVVVVLA